MREWKFYQHPVSISLLVHFSVLAVLVFFSMQWSFSTRKKMVDFEVIEYPVSPNANLKLEPRKENVVPKKQEPKKSVFGLSRQAITADAGVKDAAEIKAGNTVAKEQDNLKLEKDDPDSLPIPTDDYLVSSMPKIKSEIRIPYPKEAKLAGIAGPVVMDLLIDQTGQVRDVVLLKGPGYGLNEAAVEAVKKFEFSPAKVGEQSVAVKIRYTYRFVLENR